MKTESIAGNAIQKALEFGQSIWYDGLISEDDFRRMIQEDGLRGATTNPAIFEKALSGNERDADIKKLAQTLNAEQIYLRLAVEAVQKVADVFRPVFENTEGRDGFVSIEVSPLLAYDADKTLRQAREIYQEVNRKNIMIKIPATLEGLSAIESAIAEGIPVNVTLIFSVSRYRAVMEAYLRGLERRLANGHTIASAASVASFFVSRVDTAIDKLLEDKRVSASAPEKDILAALIGQAGIANSKVAYEAFEKTFSSDRFQNLRHRGARPQRPLWASTGTKNPNFSDVRYVEALMGEQTVNTVPPPTLAAFKDHGICGARLKEGISQAHETLKSLSRAGIVIELVTERLEKEGVQLFIDAYKNILKRLEEKMK